MGIHSERSLGQCTFFEAEMRRRLWWAMVLLDTRLAGLSGSKTITLEPSWDCKVPLNVSDTDLQPEMKVPPAMRGDPTDAVFAVVRSELGEHIRHTTFHLEFANPNLKPIARHFQNGSALESGDIAKLEEKIEDKYLKFCVQDNPLHFMTTWSTRAQLAKHRLMEHNWRVANSSIRRGEAQYDAATAAALIVLECDTKVMSSPLTKGFIWLNISYFPFPAYYQIAQDLRRRPTCEQAQQGWDTMSENWKTWFNIQFGSDSPIFQLFSKIVLQSWEAYEAAPKPPEQTLATPTLVSTIRDALAQVAGNIPNQFAAMKTNEFPMPMPTSMSMPSDSLNESMPHGTGMHSGYTWPGPGMSFASIAPGQNQFDAYLNQMDWNAFDGWPR